jgi:hypothetical protein
VGRRPADRCAEGGGAAHWLPAGGHRGRRGRHLAPEVLAERLMLAIYAYATAIREGTASTEAVLSRFTRSATHPACSPHYGPGALHEDFARFRFLLGVTDGEGVFTADER